MSNPNFSNECVVQLKISKTEKGSFTTNDGFSDGCSIFCSFLNTSNEIIRIEYIESYIVTNRHEQFNSNYFYTGYDFLDGNIYKNSSVTRGEIYLDTNTRGIKNGWIYHIEFDDTTNRVHYSISFQLKNASSGTWDMISCDCTPTDSQSFSPNKEIAKSLKAKVDRINSFEDQLGVRIDNVSFVIPESMNSVQCYYSLFAQGELTCDINIKVVIYDLDGDIIGNASNYVSSSSFMGFESFDASFYSITPSEIGRILIFPTR